MKKYITVGGNIENQITAGGNIENRSASESEPEYGDGTMRDQKINGKETADRKRANVEGAGVEGTNESNGDRLCLTSPADIGRIMKRYGFAFSKSLGQNFLIDSHAVDAIIGAVERSVMQSAEGRTNFSADGAGIRCTEGAGNDSSEGAGNLGIASENCDVAGAGNYSPDETETRSAEGGQTEIVPEGDIQTEDGQIESGRIGDVLIIEIGPGFGVLTERLCEMATRIGAKMSTKMGSKIGAKVIAIEKDKSLPPILREIVPAANLEIICEDVLECDLDAMIRDAGYEQAVVVANLPYYITTPIIMKVLEDAKRVKSLVVMMQKEVADRILDRGDRGAITMTAGYYAESSPVASIKRNSFMPAPKVDSAVLSMTRLPRRLEGREERMYMRLVRAIYSSRRKTLSNSLNSLNLCDKKRLSDVIIEIGYSPLVRGETLGIEDLLILSKKFTALEER